MDLMTAELRTQLPPLYANTHNVSAFDAIAHLKLFDPCGRYTLFVTEFDGEDLLFGYCLSPLGEDCDEWGYSSLAELSETRNAMGLGLERDLSFMPTPIRECLRQAGLAKPATTDVEVEGASWLP